MYNNFIEICVCSFLFVRDYKLSFVVKDRPSAIRQEIAGLFQFVTKRFNEILKTNDFTTTKGEKVVGFNSAIRKIVVRKNVYHIILASSLSTGVVLTNLYLIGGQQPLK